MFHTARSVFACLAALQKLHICDPLASGSPGASGAMTSIVPYKPFAAFITIGKVFHSAHTPAGVPLNHIRCHDGLQI